MTPEEYERRPEVKEALKFVRKNRDLLLHSSTWTHFKRNLMKLLGVPEDQYFDWEVPLEFQYAHKRVTIRGQRGWPRQDAFDRLIKPAIREGRLSLEGADPEPESEPDPPDGVEMELGDVTIRAQRVGVGVPGADPDEMTYAFWIKVDYDELEFAFITSNKAITDRQLIIVALGWLFDALKMGLEGFTRHFLGPDPYPELEKPVTEKAQEIFEFATKWEMQLLEAAKRIGPEVRDQLDGEDLDGR